MRVARDFSNALQLFNISNEFTNALLEETYADTTDDVVSDAATVNVRSRKKTFRCLLLQQLQQLYRLKQRCTARFYGRRRLMDRRHFLVAERRVIGCFSDIHADEVCAPDCGELSTRRDSEAG